MMRSYWELLHAAEAVEPSADMITYDLPISGRSLEVGARLAAHGRDPDDDPDLEIFFSRGPYVHPPADIATVWRFTAEDNGREFLWFWAGGGRTEALSLDPILLPEDEGSGSYELRVREYVEQACELLRRESRDSSNSLQGYEVSRADQRPRRVETVSARRRASLALANSRNTYPPSATAVIA
jgi:hypothetical protein